MIKRKVRDVLRKREKKIARDEISKIIFDGIVSKVKYHFFTLTKRFNLFSNQ